MAGSKKGKKDEPAKERHWLDRSINVGVALIGLVGGYLLAQLDIGEDHEKESREAQIQVYRDYLKSAALYRDSSYRALKDFQYYRKHKTPYATVQPSLKVWEDARRSYQDNSDQIDVYGSEGARRARDTISTSLLPSLGGVQIDDLPPSTAEKVSKNKKMTAAPGPDYVEFSNGYRDFVYHFCKDVSPLEEPNCTTA